MKKIIKLVFSIILVICLVLIAKIIINSITNKVVSNILKPSEEEKLNSLGLPKDVYGTPYGVNGEDFDQYCFSVNVRPISEEKLAQNLVKAKEEIANEDIKNTYKSLFTDERNESKEFTNFDANNISLQTLVDYDTQFYNSFEEAMNKDQNYLLYLEGTCAGSPFLYAYVKGLGHIIGAVECDTYNGSSLVFSIENKYFSRIKLSTYSELAENGTKNFVPFVDTIDRWDVGMEEQEKEYVRNNGWNASPFSRMNSVGDENCYKSETWYSNEDLIKVPITGPNGRNVNADYSRSCGYKNTYLDYQDNMIMTTTDGFFNKQRSREGYKCKEDENGKIVHDGNNNIVLDGFDFTIFESNFTELSSRYETTHVWGLKRDHFNWATKENRFDFRDCSDLLITDFSNYFYSSVSYGSTLYDTTGAHAFFGEYANNWLSCLLDEIFDDEMKPCNNFDEDINNLTIAQRHYEEAYDDYNGGAGCGVDLHRCGILFEFRSKGMGLCSKFTDGSTSESYIKITTDKEKSYYRQDKYILDGVQLTVLAEEYAKYDVKPYLKEYVVYGTTVTANYWSFENSKIKRGYETYEATPCDYYEWDEKYPDYCCGKWEEYVKAPTEETNIIKK